MKEYEQTLETVMNKFRTHAVRSSPLPLRKRADAALTPASSLSARTKLDSTLRNTFAFTAAPVQCDVPNLQ